MAGKSVAEPPWLVTRGYFLIPVNCISLLFILFLVLPIVTVGGGLLYLVKRIQNNPTSWSYLTFHQIRSTTHLLVSSLVFAFFPFQKEPHKIFNRIKPVNMSKISRWKIVVALLWLLAFEITIPLVDIITDFQFAAQLLEVYRDAKVQGRGQLLVWVIMSFVASCIGLLSELVSAGLEISLNRRQLNLPGLKRHAVEMSPFGTPLNKIMIQYGKKVVTLLGEDLLQIIIACNTISYVGHVSPLWGFKLNTSIVSCSIHMAKYATYFVFGRKISKQSRIFLQGVYFLLFTVILTTLAGSTTHDEYCSYTRTIDKPDELVELSYCKQLNASLTVTKFTKETQGVLQVTSLNYLFNVTDNRVPLALEFRNAATLNSTLLVQNNPSNLTIQLTELRSLTKNGKLLIFNNSNLVLFDVSVLFKLKEGSRFQYENNSEQKVRTFYGLTKIAGSMVVKGNHFTTLVLSLFSKVDIEGSLVISENPNMEEIWLKTFSMPFLTCGYLTLNITANPSLRSAHFPNISDLVLHKKPTLLMKKRKEKEKTNPFSPILPSFFFISDLNPPKMATHYAGGLIVFRRVTNATSGKGFFFFFSGFFFVFLWMRWGFLCFSLLSFSGP